jgi:hypothetical protein
VDQVEPFAEYLEFIFENKEGHALGSREKANNWLPFDELHAELFFPTRNYVRQTHSIACHLAEVAAATFLIEFQDHKKATSDYLSSISGIRSWVMVSDKDKLASQGKDATTSNRRACMLHLLLDWASRAPYASITLLQKDRHVPTMILVVVMSDW